MSLSTHTHHLTTLNTKFCNHYMGNLANLPVNGHVKFDEDWLNDKHIHSAHFLKGDPELVQVGSLQDPVLRQTLHFEVLTQDTQVRANPILEVTTELQSYQHSHLTYFHFQWCMTLVQ